MGNEYTPSAERWARQPTIGPWRFHAQDGGDIRVLASDGDPVAFLDLEYSDVYEAEANARLIAAAPDMLAALQRLLAPMASWGGCCYCAPGFGAQWHDLDCPVVAARAAIAKATGQPA